jgi:2'-5' RNA ligase
VSPLPREMADRWQSRPEPGPGQVQLYWHILMKDQPEVQALLALAQQRLACFPGLHFTPPQWLHSTVLRVGLMDGIDEMIERARQRLRAVCPVSVSIGRVLYHPEAIALAVRHDGALDAVFDAVRAAAQSTIGRPEDAGWIPHVTAAYCTAVQPSGPIIAALGRELPECEITVSSVSLIAQHGAERDWDWRLVADIQLGPAAAA